MGFELIIVAPSESNSTYQDLFNLVWIISLSYSQNGGKSEVNIWEFCLFWISLVQFLIEPGGYQKSLVSSF